VIKKTRLLSYKNVLSIPDNKRKYTYNKHKPISEMYSQVSTNTYNIMFTSTAIYGNTIGCVSQNNVIMVRFICIIITYEFLFIYFFYYNFEPTYQPFRLPCPDVPDG